MSVDSRGSYQKAEGKKKRKPKTQTKQMRQKKATEGDQEKTGSEEQKAGRQRRTAKGASYDGVDMRDLQGLQASLASVEVTLHAVLEGIGEDRTRKRSSACQKLSG